ncbi:MAG: 2-hydroxyacyl-CoA dehydratase, partial [Chloroflexota bacterium]
TRYRQMVEAMELIRRHRQHRPTTRSDELYYEMLVDYYRRPLTALEGGTPLVAQAAYVPTELLYAMDLVPFHLESFSVISPSVLRNFEELDSAAKGFGFAPEICSAHRVLASQFLLGWFTKPDIIEWSNQVCANTSKSGELLMDLYNIPGFFIDRPYRF